MFINIDDKKGSKQAQFDCITGTPLIGEIEVTISHKMTRKTFVI